MPILIALGTFLFVTLLLYGILYKPMSDGAMGDRLGGLRYTRPKRDTLPDPNAAFKTRVVEPLIRGLNRRVTNLLPANLESRLEGSITQAGLTISPGQFIVIVAVMMGFVPLLMVGYFAATGAPVRTLLLVYGGMVGFGFYGPRMWLLGRIKKRQKAIWRSLPDAFDLITASVEAGLGIDAAFTRVIEKVSGPFQVELGKTMREISMGRSRRDAFLDMADRTGVEELRSLINSVVQAESMGISIGAVIRVQTGVIRTKRRQRAEEQAFKAPIKMVFPLVFFIFPAIFVVIGGPAAIQMKDAF